MKALSIYGGKLMQQRARREATHGREAKSDQEVILKLLTLKHNTRPCSLPGLRRKETITTTHTVDVF